MSKMSKMKKQELRNLITTFPIDYGAIEAELAYLQNRLTKDSYERFITNTILQRFWSNRTYAVFMDGKNLLGSKFVVRLITNIMFHKKLKAGFFIIGFDNEKKAIDFCDKLNGY